MKRMSLTAVICIAVCFGCAGSQINQTTLAHDLAWDVGYVGYALSPKAQASLEKGCDVFARISDPEVSRGALVALLSEVWTEANTPEGMAIVLAVNNLVNTLGLNTGQVMANTQAIQVREAIGALCDGVQQARATIK